MLAMLGLWLAYRSGKRRRLVDDIPTSKTTGVFIGLTELKGTAEVDCPPLVSYLAEISCVHFLWNVQERWSRTVIETYTDSKGNIQTRTRHESGWTTVASGGGAIPFYLKDDFGVIRVLPEGAQIEPLSVFSETCGRGDSLYYAKGPSSAIANSDHIRQFTETAIPLHTPLYVMGQARERQDVVAPEIAEDKNAPLFLISTRTEKQISSGYKWKQRGLLILGLIVCIGGFIWRDSQLNFRPESRVLFYALAGAGYLFTAVLGWVWMVYNSLVGLRQRVRQAWSQVDIQLKRRFDLIPNLVETVKGYRDHEARLQTELAQIRSQMIATPPGVTGPDYAAVTKTLFAIREAYPELNASESFLRLQKELSDTEQRIALARGYFNEIAYHYNVRLEIIPDRFVARLALLQPQPLMAANDFERAPVVVSFQ